MRRTLCEGDVALDVGAHKGAYTYWIRRKVGATGTVFAFEPQVPLADYLARSADAFGWDNVHVQAIGLSSAAGERTLHVPGDGSSPSASFVAESLIGPSTAVTTRVDTLDQWLERTRLDRPIRFIKCDVEGHELDVFRGGIEMLRIHKPLLLFECEQRHDPKRTVVEVFAFLRQLGYRGHFYWRNRETAVEDFQPEVHQVLGGGAYVNSFVFRCDGPGA
jgi:FkbM family methyltransferase